MRWRRAARHDWLLRLLLCLGCVLLLLLGRRGLGRRLRGAMRHGVGPERCVHGGQPLLELGRCSSSYTSLASLSMLLMK